MPGKCLVVDDMEELLESIVRSCSRVGFEAIGKTTFQEAKDFIESSQELKLLVTDFALDEGSGLELIEIYQAKYPQNWAYVISGYDRDELLAKKPGLNADTIEFIEKPFSLKEFKNSVKDKFGL